ncbi:DEAD/DEAH box helicase family protein [Macrococcus capreoli]
MRITISETPSSQPAIEYKSQLMCHFCLNQARHLFHQYYHHGYQQTIYYCRSCITQSVHSRKYIHYLKTAQFAENIVIDLPFELTAQQSKASQFIVNKFEQRKSCLLYAVTGAGKTEMILAGIVAARAQGCNVAVVSPRTDVVKELSLRLSQYLKTDYLCTLYGGHAEITSDHFIISTIHQLMYFQDHFDLIIIDEIDAFPVGYDPRLIRLLNRALTEHGMFVYLSATPPKYIMQACKTSTIYLPLRYHQRPLPEPRFKFMSKGAVEHKMSTLLAHAQCDEIILIFFHDIKLMEATYTRLNQHLQRHTVCVYSTDVERHEKVEAIRNKTYRFIFTTTILERGFTMQDLSVWVMNSHLFRSDSLIQIAGRVDRKGNKQNGEVIFYHDGISLSMLDALKKIRQMNKRGAHDTSALYHMSSTDS